MKGDAMDYSISKSKLQRAIKLAGYNTYEEVAAAGLQRGVYLSARNLYKLASGANYTKQTLEALCLLLNCSPGDLVEAWHIRSNDHTHGSPQPNEVEQHKVSSYG